MMTVEERVLAASTKREELLATIAATEHAHAELTRIKIDLAALKGKSWDADQLFSTWSTRAEKEQQEFEKLRGSKFKKLFTKSSSYKQDLKREEDEAIEASEWKEKADKAMREMRRQVDEMKKTRDSLQKMKDDRLQAQIDLDRLYESVFDGPTLDKPEEDELERQQQVAQQTYDEIQDRHSKTASVAKYVWMAMMSTNGAAASARYALSHSKNDFFDLSTTGPRRRYNTFADADWEERRQLGRVQKNLIEALQLLEKAHELDPDVRGFVMPELADGSSLAGLLDEFLNTPVTDYMFHREIQEAAEAVDAVCVIVDEQFRFVEGKKLAIECERHAASKTLADARKRLSELRIRIFEQVLRGEKEEEPAPPYTAVASDNTSA
ncbi:hypothetical protein QQS21_006422 [Conoideocrella luteorostrata]|uniref:Uncharacterized protein n=1 Tax=Conoideocrella luteorostrata TaxID=1105319 RepID=A0AAJ0CNE8_9HYPO|nr:hypothetical protein QQS21_006422 [Conoideocrella luteorostrata]